MSTATRRPLAEAHREAEAFRDLFKGCFEEWVIAGSIRRRKETVGDVEHVAIPKFAKLPVGLLGEEQTVNMVWECAQALLEGGQITKHVYQTVRGPQTRWGDKYRGIEFQGFNHEIFLADRDNFGSVLAIRTGPAELSKDLVTRLYHYNYQQKDGYVMDRNTGRMVPCPREEMFFKMAGLAMATPDKR